MIFRYDIYMGGVRLQVTSPRELTSGTLLDPFIKPTDFDRLVTIQVRYDFSSAPLPTTKPAGMDMIQTFYVQDDTVLVACLEGKKGYLALSVCGDDFSNICCFINERPFPAPIASLEHIFRLMPIRQILLKSGVAFLHASQVFYGGKGIVFTAPSGTGKTTQAKLWARHLGAQILCNDRVLIRNGLSYGCPMDGSEPIRTNRAAPLGALVVLHQGPEDRVRRLRPGEALSKLMPMMLIDPWDPTAMTAASALLLRILDLAPVYELYCLPDESAVRCLHQALTADGVIS